MRRRSRCWPPDIFAAICFTTSIFALAGFASPAGAISDNFESPHVHPVEISPDGTRLFVVHTADARLVVFDLTAPGAPTRVAEIPVGLEPVTVRARTNNEVWVVNHVSDSISLVDLTTGNVVRTLLVGDEPTDVVFAGTPERAFVCLSQEDRIRVYDPLDLDAEPTDIPLSASDPRALAVSLDGTKIFVCVFESGNQTTIVPFATVAANGGSPPPKPPMDLDLPPAPDVALIVKHEDGHWVDEIGRSWDPVLPYTLLDQDVIEISIASLTPTRAFRGVGTNLFDVAVHPVTGRLYVSNQEADNATRFVPNIRGRFAQNRVTIVDPLSAATHERHLNGHIDYADLDGNPIERAQSLSIPMEIAIRSDGSEVFVAAFGSHKVGVLDSDAQLTRRIEVGQGPTGLALDETRERLYVVNRFPSTLSVVNLTDDSSIEIPLGFDPTSPTVREGRRLFYDGANSSAHGDLSCATCHVFGGLDAVAWDLGDPTGEFVPPESPFLSGFHPMKGPMTTQSLKSLPDTEPFHWRGDREGLINFNPAFVDLMGRETELTQSEFDLFQEFVFSLQYPPNPFRFLDGSLAYPEEGEPDPYAGEVLFFTPKIDEVSACADCHALPTGTSRLISEGAAILTTQDMKVPQLRNLYEKTRFDNSGPTSIRGFGYTHDGASDDLFSFLQSPRFAIQSDDDRRNLAAYLLAFDTGMHAAVGAQWTMDGTNHAEGIGRLQILAFVAEGDQAGLIAKGRDSSGEARGWTYVGSGSWISDRQSEGNVSFTALLALDGPGTEITYTAVVHGTELRLGVDRDGDGYRDRDELDGGSDPGDPESIPNLSALAGGISGGWKLSLEPPAPNPVVAESGRFSFAIAEAGSVRLTVHDVEGRLVRTLVETPLHSAGRFEKIWDLTDDTGRSVTRGLYFVRLTSSSDTRTGRIVIQR